MSAYYNENDIEGRTLIRILVILVIGAVLTGFIGC